MRVCGNTFYISLLPIDKNSMAPYNMVRNYKGVNDVEIEIDKLPKYEMMRRRAQEYINADEDTVETYWLFFHVARQLLSTFQNQLERYGLSDGKMVLLLLLRHAPNNTLTPSELAERCEVTRGTITGLLDGLERSGLIARKNHPEDRRMLTIQLTEQGVAFIDEVVPQRFRRFNDMIQRANLSKDEQQQFMTILKKVMHGIPALLED
jgi:DNA-binding MarR family transcriptional regulator